MIVINIYHWLTGDVIDTMYIKKTISYAAVRGSAPLVQLISTSGFT